MKLLCAFLLFAALSYGEQAASLEQTAELWKSATASPNKGEVESLEKTVDKWKPILHMKDWTITVRPVPMVVLEAIFRVKCIATSTWDVEARTGTILVLMRSGYTPAVKKEWEVKNVKADQRDSIVHEMIHNVVDNMNDEAAVRTITRALKP